MKLIKPTILLCLLLSLYSCHNQKSKKEDPVNSDVSIETSENPILKGIEQNLQENLQPIELVVKEILTTSPRYIELTKGIQERLVKNGGLYFGVYLERSPERIKETEDRYSRTYNFTIYEMYEERKLNTARFTFNPNNHQLYEYDMVNDSMLPIGFDKTLILKYDSLNK